MIGGVALGLLAVGACGSADDTATPIVAGATASSPADPEAPPASEPVPATSAPTATTVAPPSDPGDSPVEGLDALALQEAVAAPPGPAARTATGPVAEQVTLADGRTVWRVRLPGPFPVRSALAVVTVGTQEIGVGVLTPGLDAMVAVSLSGTGLVAGAPVSLRWGSAPAESVGTLAVVR